MLKERMNPRIRELFPVTDGEMEEYRIEFLERAGRHMDEGISQEEADRLALDEMGCIEYWQHARKVNHVK